VQGNINKKLYHILNYGPTFFKNPKKKGGGGGNGKEQACHHYKATYIEEETIAHPSK
jgi:hypothetical protein